MCACHCMHVSIQEFPGKRGPVEKRMLSAQCVMRCLNSCPTAALGLGAVCGAINHIPAILLCQTSVTQLHGRMLHTQHATLVHDLLDQAAYRTAVRCLHTLLLGYAHAFVHRLPRKHPRRSRKNHKPPFSSTSPTFEAPWQPFKTQWA